MGTTMHLHIEIKIDGKWEHYSVPTIKRNYSIFSKMANVRNDEGSITPVSQPKGIPNDITLITSLDHKYTGRAAHSMSWLGLSEIKELFEWLRDDQNLDLEDDVLQGYLFDNAFCILPSDKSLSSVTDVRFVFWFDN